MLANRCDAGRQEGSEALIAAAIPPASMAATTHHSDMHMRYVQLDVVAQPRPSAIDVRAPLNDKFAPRGNYMMFVVTNLGAVADALWVVLR